MFHALSCLDPYSKMLILLDYLRYSPRSAHRAVAPGRRGDTYRCSLDRSSRLEISEPSGRYIISKDFKRWFSSRNLVNSRSIFRCSLGWPRFHDGQIFRSIV